MARNKRLVDPGSGSKSGPVKAIKADPKAWGYAKKHGGNKVLRPNSDGSVTITNKDRKTRG